MLAEITVAMTVPLLVLCIVVGRRLINRSNGAPTGGPASASPPSPRIPSNREGEATHAVPRANRYGWGWADGNPSRLAPLATL
jgi:hypothetical protein